MLTAGRGLLMVLCALGLLVLAALLYPIFSPVH